MCDQAHFLNELILANQRTKFHFFSIIIDLESPEIITKWFDWDWEKNQRLVRKSRFLNYLLIFNERFDWQHCPRGKVVQNEEINIWYEDLVFYVNYEHAQQCEVIFYTNIVFLRAILLL